MSPGSPSPTGEHLRHRTGLITGCSSGLGRALAEAVIGRGERVVATARDPSAIADLEGLAPDRVRAVRLDVTDASAAGAAVAEGEAAFGGVDVAVNNAGDSRLGAFEEHTEPELRRAFETNLFGALHVTRAVLPGMRRRRAGHVVQLSSVIGVTSGLGGAAYAGPKAALEAMSEAIAAEVAPFGVRVTIVQPGAFRTDFGGKSLRWATAMDEYADRIGPARAAFEASHGTQAGDPARAAAAIVAAVDHPDPPLRLPLGTDAFTWIRAYLEGRLDELAAGEPLGADTAFR